MNGLDDIAVLTELRIAPLTLRMALYNITIESELEERGCPSGSMERLKERLQDALDFSYYKLEKISWEMYDYLYDCFLADESESKSESKSGS